jgi:hypothetical protein
MDRAYKLLGILQSYAPSEVAQQKCTTLYNKMQYKGLTTKEIELNLVIALHDGLAYGNWVWDL